MRILCVIVVLFYHYGAFTQHDSKCSSGFECSFRRIFSDVSAFSFLDFFFITSGVVTELPQRAALEGLAQRCRYLAGKWLRMAPVYYVGLLFGVIVGLAFSSTCDERFTIPRTTLILDVFMVQSWASPIPNMKTPVWASADCPDQNVETIVFAMPNPPEWFVSSLLGCFLLHALCFQRVVFSMAVSPWVSLACSIFLATVRTIFHLLYAVFDGGNESGTRYALTLFPPSALSAFLSGAFLAKFVNQMPADGAVRSSRIWMVLDSAAVLLTIYAFSRPAPGTQMTCGAYVICAATLIMLVASVGSENNKGLAIRFLEHPALSSLGPGAFAAYSVQSPFVRFLLGTKWDFDHYLTFPVFVVGTVFLGGLIFLLVDYPCRVAISRWKWLKVVQDDRPTPSEPAALTGSSSVNIAV
jgi:hypothetical protein